MCHLLRSVRGVALLSALALSLTACVYAPPPGPVAYTAPGYYAYPAYPAYYYAPAVGGAVVVRGYR